MKFADVTLTIPTRGDVDLTPILNGLPDFADVIVWDNSDPELDDYGIYSRYAAIQDATTDVIATQDDDVIVTCWDQILAAYRSNRLTVNYPEPWDIPWVARGGIFHHALPAKAFRRYIEAGHNFDRDFTHHQCDAVFALLTESVFVFDGGSEDLPHGFDPGRVSTSRGWYDRLRPQVQERCLALR